MKRFWPVFLLIPGLSWATQPKSYPTSPVTQIRLDTYLDGFTTIADSTWTVDTSTWVILDWNYWSLQNNQVVIGTKYEWSGSSWIVTPSIVTLQKYTDMVKEAARDRWITEGLENVEPYMVWPDTNPAVGWKGWCLGSVNGVKIPITCP